MPPRLFQPVPPIRFVCRPEDFGVIAEPKSAKSVMPDWFRKLPSLDKLLLLLLLLLLPLSLLLFLLELLLLLDLLYAFADAG